MCILARFNLNFMANHGHGSHHSVNANVFDLLTPEELSMVNENKHEVVYKPGETIFKQGAACTHLLTFSSGMAKIHMTGSNERNLIIRLIKPIEYITGAGLLGDNIHHYSVTAIEKSSVSFTERMAFIKVLESNMVFTKAFMRLSQKNLIQTLNKLLNLNQKNNQGKIAEALLYLSDEIYEANPFTLNISKVELSEMAGMSKESTFKILKSFDNEGIITVSGNSIEILKKDLLSHISEKG